MTCVPFVRILASQLPKLHEAFFKTTIFCYCTPYVYAYCTIFLLYVILHVAVLFSLLKVIINQNLLPPPTILLAVKVQSKLSFSTKYLPASTVDHGGYTYFQVLVLSKKNIVLQKLSFSCASIGHGQWSGDKEDKGGGGKERRTDGRTDIAKRAFSDFFFFLFLLLYFVGMAGCCYFLLLAPIASH